VKCEAYWPALGNCLKFGNIKVDTTDEKYFGDLVRRKLTVQNEETNVRSCIMFYIILFERILKIKNQNIAILLKRLRK